MAAAEMGQRMRQAHMRHTDPRLTECTYMDESLLPVAEELSRVPAILAPGEPAPEAIPLRATGTDGNAMCVANLQQTFLTSGNCLAFDGNDGGAQIGESGSAQVASAQEESPGLSGLVGKAGERIRTVDIHVGKVCARVAQSATCQEVASIEVDARSKYAARNAVRIKHVSASGVGEWPGDPDYARSI